MGQWDSQLRNNKGLKKPSYNKTRSHKQTNFFVQEWQRKHGDLCTLISLQLHSQKEARTILNSVYKSGHLSF